MTEPVTTRTLGNGARVVSFVVVLERYAEHGSQLGAFTFDGGVTSGELAITEPNKIF